MPEVGYHKYAAIKKWRYKIFWPLALLLKNIGITANQVSLIGFVLVLLFVAFIYFNPVLAGIFLLAHVLADGLDGALARAWGSSGSSGVFVDIVIDHCALFLVVLALVQIDMINAILGMSYIFLYIMMMALTIGRYLSGSPARFVVRSRLVVYAAYGLWAFTQLNYLNYVLLIFSGLMLPVVIMDIWQLKKTLVSSQQKLTDY